MFKKSKNEVTFELAMFDPAGVFANPDEVLNHKKFNKDQKIEILEQWLRDERELSVAEEENMPGEDRGYILDAVHRALLKLGVDSESHQGPPTKHGF